MTHTKGPWTVGEYKANTGRVEIETVERGIDCPQFGYIIGWVLAADKNDANARLIAAAPDMLEALEIALEQGDFQPKVKEIIVNTINKAKGVI